MKHEVFSKEMLQQRQFAFGETRKATIQASEPGFLVALDDCGEGHLLWFDHKAREKSEFDVGDRGTLTFTKGGPAGGFWKFTKEGE